MRWSWPDYLETPEDVIDEVKAWMRDEHAEAEKARLEAKRNQARAAAKRGRR